MAETKFPEHMAKQLEIFRLFIAIYSHLKRCVDYLRDGLSILLNCLTTDYFPTEQIGLITVFDAILNSRQRRLELQCLYGNSMSNNS